MDAITSAGVEMKTSRSAVLALALATACTSGSGEVSEAEVAEAPRPNVLYIIADDFGAPYHGFMGDTIVQTPSLDALAERGVVFENGYAPANHCRPSLRSFVTGLLPIEYDRLEARNRAAFVSSAAYGAMSSEEQAVWNEQYQFHSMADVQTLPRLLGEAGYVTWQGGKWWEFTYENGGFDQGMTTGWDPEDRGRDDWFLQFMGGDGRDLARVSNQAAFDFVEQAGDRPWMMWYAPELPHYPFDAPEEFQAIYDRPGLTQSAQLYYANATWFDTRLGELFDFLREWGQLENTLIAYVNDNGWEQEPDQEYVGDPMRYNNGGDKGKLGLTDLSFRSPILFSWPGRIESGIRRDQLIHGADIPATILDYLGVELRDPIFGRSFVAEIEDPAAPGRPVVQGRIEQTRSPDDMMGRDARGYWLREDDWFFSWDLDLDEVRLVDLATDPMSETNLAEANPERVARYRQAVEAWIERYEG